MNKAEVGKQRSSNLELYRIVTMLLIIGHHYVVNSGLTAGSGPIMSNLQSLRSIFLMVVGAFGKTGINCFVMITGYFMCKSQITLKKFLKMYLQIVFYRIVILLIFCICGLEALTAKKILLKLVPFRLIGDSFTPSFILFWLLIPFLNVLVRNMNKRQHLLLAGLLLLAYSVLPTFGGFINYQLTFNYVSWFCILYLAASFIRLYSNAFFSNTKLWGLFTLGVGVLSVVSVVLPMLQGRKGTGSIYFFLQDSNKILAFALAFCSFNWFRNLKIPYSPVINAFGGATFGVFLIHAHSKTMREWLWKTLLDNVGAYQLSKVLLPLHFFGSVLGVFLVCALIDLIRTHVLEKPLLKLYDQLAERAGKKRLQNASAEAK